MFSKLKLWAVIIGGALIMGLFAMLQISEKKRVKFKAAVEKKSGEIRDRAHKANLDGAIDEHEAMVKPIDKIKDEF